MRETRAAVRDLQGTIAHDDSTLRELEEAIEAAKRDGDFDRLIRLKRDRDAVRHHLRS